MNRVIREMENRYEEYYEKFGMFTEEIDNYNMQIRK